MDDTHLLNNSDSDRETLFKRLKYLENEIKDIKKELGPEKEVQMNNEKPPDCSECCKDFVYYVLS